jgi:hypothetical protein
MKRLVIQFTGSNERTIHDFENFFNFEVKLDPQFCIFFKEK